MTLRSSLRRDRTDRTDPRFEDIPVREDDIKLGEESYWLDPDMDATDPEHLEIDGDGSGSQHVQGLVDSITEGTISVPHSHAVRAHEALIDQYEIDEATKEVLKGALPALGLDLIKARRMVPHRITLSRTSATVPGPMGRVLFANDARRFFVVLIETALGDAYLSTSNSTGGNSDTVYVQASTQPFEFWHNGEVYVGAGVGVASVTLNVLEFMAS